MKHGTSSGYRYHGCRCPLCTAAATAQTRAINVRKRLEAGPTEAEALAIQSMPGEEWRPVTEFDGYEVSNLGRIRSTKFTYPRILSTHRNHNGYVKVRLWQDNQHYYRFLHALVTAAFIGPRPEGLEVRHLNDDKLNNRADNLVYGTRSQNIRDAVRNGKWHQSTKTHCPKGHPYDEVNTYIRPKGWRACRACQTARRKAAAA